MLTLGELAKNTESTTVANANKDGFTKNQQAVLDNKALFMPNGSWVVDEMKDAPRADGFEWGMAAVPTLKEGGKQYAYTFLEHIWIPKEAKQQKQLKNSLPSSTLTRQLKSSLNTGLFNQLKVWSASYLLKNKSSIKSMTKVYYQV